MALHHILSIPLSFVSVAHEPEGISHTAMTINIIRMIVKVSDVGRRPDTVLALSFWCFSVTHSQYCAVPLLVCYQVPCLGVGTVIQLILGGKFKRNLDYIKVIALPISF